MANSTTFLTIPAAQRSGTETVYIEKEVDFSIENVASAGTIDVLNLPKGCVLLHAGWIVKTTQATVTFALSVPTASITVKSAAVMGANNVALVTAPTSNKVLAAVDTLRVTVGAATAATAKVVFFAEYFVSDACRN